MRRKQKRCAEMGLHFVLKELCIDTYVPCTYSCRAALLEARVHRLASVVLTGILSLALIEIPAMAAPAANPPAAPLGVVVAAENANVGASATMSGSTIYDGDRLQTQPGSTLRVRLGLGQMALKENTITDVHAFPKGFAANLNAGTVTVSSPAGQTFQIVADGATIRPANDQPTSGQISMISPTELVLTGTRGTMLVSMGDEVQTLEAGSSYRLDVEADEAAPSSDPQAPHPTARSRFLWVLIPAIAVVTGIVIWRAVESPSAPH